MDKYDGLFELIHSLNKSEKGYFKKYSKLHGHGDKKYLKLFDTLNMLGSYNKNKIEAVFKKEAKSRQLSVIKSYLYELILKSLEAYHYNIAAELRSGINQAEILYEKGLFRQCKHLLGKIKKLAWQYESYVTLYEISRIEENIARQSRPTDIQKHKANYKNILDVLDKLINIETYAELEGSLFIIARNYGHGISDLVKEKYKKIVNSPWLKTEAKTNTLKSKLTFNKIHSLYYLFTYDYKNALPYAQKETVLLESNPKYIVANPFAYVISLSKLSNILSRLKKYDTAVQVIQKIKTIEHNFNITLDHQKKMMVFNSSHMAELSMYKSSAQFNKIDMVLPGMLEGLQKYGGTMDAVTKSIHFHNISYMKFGNKQYKQSLEWVNKIFNLLPREELRPDIYYHAMAFRLIIHFELGNLELLSYLLKSFYRAFHQNQNLRRAELILLELIRKILKEPNIVTSKTIIKHYGEIRKKLILLAKKQPDEAEEMNHYFDYISWLTAKIEKKDFVEVLREKLYN